ncbi:MAG: hypothetical protein DMG76_18355 [Acidobacteria bacterium]|nr:MAG: hypothetical protein DMG76_18355 [Acidobacteriota bacterium]
MKLLAMMPENTCVTGADAQARLLFRSRSARSMAGHKKAQRRRADIFAPAKSSSHETRMLRLLYTTSVLIQHTPN